MPSQQRRLYESRCHDRFGRKAIHCVGLNPAAPCRLCNDGCAIVFADREAVLSPSSPRTAKSLKYWALCALCALCESLLLFLLAKIAKIAKDVQLLGVLSPLRSQAARLRHAQPTSARAFVTICSLAKLAKLAKDFQATWGTGSLCDLKLRAFLTRSLALRESSSVFSRQDRQGRQELPNP